VFVKPFEFGIVTLHDLLKGAGVDQAYGPAIISFTLVLKLLTFPLNKQQIESTTKMQAIQPAAKKLQEKYRNADPARLNMELQKLYTDNQVNPLAGCLPSLAQIPIFIGLYRSVLNLAKADRLDESFLWLPSLEGPVSDYTNGISWLTGNADLGYNWANGAPPLGWEATGAYLVLPVLLVVSQFVSMEILSPPKSDDPAQQQSQAILKFLPFMIGYFSLSVPSGLGLYWMTNNIVTTLSTVLIRQGVQTPDLATAGGGPSKMAVDEPPAAQGFGRKFGEVVEKTASDGTRVTIKPPGASSKRAERRKAAAATSVDGSVIDVAASEGDEAVIDATVASAPGPEVGGKKKKGVRRSKKSKK
jgi:YidC/Oxa1 family membrane protein insertase